MELVPGFAAESRIVFLGLLSVPQCGWPLNKIRSPFGLSPQSLHGVSPWVWERENRSATGSPSAIFLRGRRRCPPGVQRMGCRWFLREPDSATEIPAA